MAELQAQGGQQSHPGHQVRPFPLHQGRLRGTRLTLRKIKLAVEGPWHLKLIIYLSELPGSTMFSYIPAARHGGAGGAEHKGPIHARA